MQLFSFSHRCDGFAVDDGEGDSLAAVEGFLQTGNVLRSHLVAINHNGTHDREVNEHLVDIVNDVVFAVVGEDAAKAIEREPILAFWVNFGPFLFGLRGDDEHGFQRSVLCGSRKDVRGSVGDRHVLLVALEVND